MTVALIVAIVGAIVYVVCERLSFNGPTERLDPCGTIPEIGRLAFVAGLLAYLIGGR